MSIEDCHRAGASVAFNGPDDLVGKLYNGYPSGRSNLPNSFGIADWMNIADGITVNVVGSGTVDFYIDSAPKPAYCSIRYVHAVSFGVEPVITTKVSGC